MRKLALYLFAAFLLTSCDNLKTKGKSAEDDTEESTSKKKKKKVIDEDEESADEEETTTKKKKLTDDEEDEVTDNSREDESDYSSKKNAKYSDGWSKAEKNVFMSNCSGEAAKSMGESRAESYCPCMMGKLEKRYPDAKTIDEMSEKDMTDLARDCLQ